MSDEPRNPTYVIADYERAILGSEGSGFEATKTALEHLVQFTNQGGLRERGNSAVVCESHYTRFCAAFSAYLANDHTPINAAQLDYFCQRKQVLAYCFAVSGYRNMGHLPNIMARKNGEELQIAAIRVPLLLAVIDLDSLTDDLIEEAKAQRPEVFLKLVLGWLGQRAVLTEKAEANRAKLLALGPLLRTAKITDRDIHPLVNAWMYCSYAEVPTKNQIKDALNALLKERMLEAGLQAKPVTYVRKSRPKMLVIHERFNTHHAMYRCYAPSLRDLTKYFDLVAVVEDRYIDDEGVALFSEVVKLQGTPDIGGLVKVVQNLAPDIIYYPSIGMTHWAIMLANLRLAPIQFMSHGHPASSMTQTIDYAYVNDLEGDWTHLHSEKLLVGNNVATFSPPKGLPDDLPPIQEPSDREVRIAVNSKVMKLSHRLLSICRRIEQDSHYPVRFSFFPGERFLFFDGLVAAIQAQLPMADVIPYVGYENFIAEVSKCDLALAAFPFGNTNSTVDTCLLGMPTVAHFGLETSAQSDKLVLNTAGLADWLICDSDELYYETALALVNDPSLRAKALNGLSRSAIRANIFKKSRDDEDNPFADVIWWAYNNHPTIQADENRVFHHSDILGSM